MKTVTPLGHTYVVRPGDTLSRIAQTQYGHAEFASSVARANGIVNQQMLQPGTLLMLPPIQIAPGKVFNYVVTGMKLIPQTMSGSCWYASTQMLISWRRRRLRRTTGDTMDPSEDTIATILKTNDNGLLNSQLVPLAKRLGLELIPPQSPSADNINAWLRHYGPLWVNGKSHIVVIAGIRSGPPGQLADDLTPQSPVRTVRTTRVEVLVYDPWPPGVGVIQWRTIDGWYYGSAADSMDTAADAPSVFMHCPSVPSP